MKIEDKVCTLEQAKRLVELGVKLETDHHWVDNNNYWRAWDRDWET